MIWIFIIIFCCIGMLYGNIVKGSEKKYLAFIILVILCVISGTRYYMGGTDYEIYLLYYQKVPTLNNFRISLIQNTYFFRDIEIGYLFVTSIVKTLGFNFFGFTLLHSIFFYTCMYEGLKKYITDYYIIIFFFLYKIFFYNTFISMRQSITLAIFFIAIHFIQEKKALKYLICCIVAISIHYGALIMVPVYFINKFQLTKSLLRNLNLVFIPTILFSYLNVPVIIIFNKIFAALPMLNNSTKVSSLLVSTGVSSIDILHTLEYFLFMFLVFVFFNKLISVDDNAEFILKLFLVLLPIFTLFRGYVIFTRLKDYFSLTYAIIAGYLCLIDNKKWKYMIQIGIVVLCIFGFFRFAVLFDRGEMMNYTSYLFENISIWE